MRDLKLCFVILFSFIPSNIKSSGIIDSRSPERQTGHLRRLTEESRPNRMIFGKGRSVNADKDSGEFVEVRKGKYFVDKTEFIRDFFDHSDDFIYLTAPSRFGKSTNLDMLRLFADFSVAPNGTRLKRKTAEDFKLFQGTKIVSHRSFFKTHCQKYAVVRLNFAQLELVKDYKSFRSEFCSIVCNTLLFEIQYRSFAEEFLNMTGEHMHVSAHPCHQFCKTNFEKALLLSLSLPTALHSYTGRKVIVLVDKYDSLLQAIVDRKVTDVDKITHDLGFFVNKLVKGNAAVSKGLFVGTLTFGGLLSEFADNVVHIKFDRSKKFAKYFAFTLDEVEGQLSKFKLSKTIGQAQEWYGGYAVENAPEFKLFNPDSTDMYLTIKELDHFWMQHVRNLLHQFLPYFSHPQIGTKIEQILFGESPLVSFTDESEASWYTFDRMKREIKDTGVTKTLEEEEVSFLLQILRDYGYFTLNSTDSPIGLRSPNRETDRLLEIYLFQSNYFRNSLHLTSKDTMQEFRYALLNLSEKDESFRQLARVIHELFVKDCSSVQNGDLTLQGVMLSSVKYIFHLFDHTADIPIIALLRKKAREHNESPKKTTILLITTNQVGIIIEPKLRRTSQEGVREILRNRYWELFHENYPSERVSYKIILGVNIDAKCSCQVSYLFNSIEANSMSTVEYPPGPKASQGRILRRNNQ